MRRAPTICAVHGCPSLAVDRGRCATHAAQRRKFQRRTVPTHVEGAKWSERQKRKAAVKAWRKRFGNVCPGYKRSAHRAVDLTAQHDVALAAGGDAHQVVSVLCRSCNSRHGAEVKNEFRSQL